MTSTSLRELAADAARFRMSLEEAAQGAEQAETAVRLASAAGLPVSPAELARALADLEMERSALAASTTVIAGLKQDCSMWQARAVQAEATLREHGIDVPEAGASSSSAGRMRPRSPPFPPPQAEGKGGPPGAGARKRQRQQRQSAELQGPVWCPVERLPHEVIPAGYKVHVGDLPSFWLDGNELEPWLHLHGVHPDHTSPMRLTPKYQRFQAILTFADEQACRHAYAALSGIDEEHPRHTTTTSWWQPRG